ncbi:DNA alkylation repair protein [Enterococcus diestrammenae]|uniref:6-O-methylguanine DNA methyltransferase n=1 Tax=Enterococcus diestrammenae TaxID=1155073 RepID=A0ABV0F7Y3_9ENTE|nr:DNA alkylation repair protein [Enterococcus diestrammenae]KAF1296311.1 6-O-methylguanine DNA methyltransferase [Enterococcus diestrammenae]
MEQLTITRLFPFEPENAASMAAYMKNQFPFCGVPSPERRRLEKPFLTASRQWALPELVATAAAYYRQPEREYQYFAIDLAQHNLKRLTLGDLENWLPLLGEKQWWDSIDAWRKVYSDWCFLHPEQLTTVFGWLYGHEDFWYRRVGINLQLKFKAQTNQEILAQGILADMATDEFFIQKAIGWSLREYSKTNPTWVADFIDTHPALSKLAVREGSKYL